VASFGHLDLLVASADQGQAFVEPMTNLGLEPALIEFRLQRLEPRCGAGPFREGAGMSRQGAALDGRLNTAPWGRNWSLDLGGPPWHVPGQTDQAQAIPVSDHGVLADRAKQDRAFRAG
jgi:hypothetical protein